MSFLEDYILLDELGQGGFATVYKVRHKSLGYTRAIRVLNQTIATGETDGMQAFMGGKLRTEGDMMLAMKLSELFPV